MVTLVKISKPELLESVAISYEGDNDLFLKYHIAPMDFMNCVMATMGMILDTAKEKELRYYTVIYKKKKIGYVVEFDDFLYSYGINIKFRKKDILIAWWREVSRVMGGKFMTMLYLNNTRCITHLRKQGFEIFQEDKLNNCVTLIYNSSHNKLKIA